MKKIKLIVALLTFNILAYSQNDTIELTLNKMSILIFDDDVVGDIGNKKEFTLSSSSNKITIRPRYKIAEQFRETNLFVQSGEQMRMFVLVYKENPKQFIWNFQSSSNVVSSIVTNEVSKKTLVVDKKLLSNKLKEKENTAFLDSLYGTNCKIADARKQDLFNKGVISKKMKVVATNFYVKEDYFYLKLVLNNSSKIDYDIKYIDFNIKNREQITSVKEDAYQFDKVDILYTYNEVTKVEGKTKQSMVFVFDKFTIGKHKKFTAKIREKNGDRIFDVDFFSDDIASIKHLEK